MSKKLFNVNGLPYGLGNKIEELVNLEAYCIRTRSVCRYYWNNEDPSFTYPALVKFKRIILSNYRLQDERPKGFFDLDPVFTTREEKLRAIKNIKILVDFKKKDVSYTGVHIRRGDRIKKEINGTENDIDYMDVTLADSLLERTAKALNADPPKNVFICSDDEDSKRNFIGMLHSRITIIDSPIDTPDDCPLVYKEFLALANSDKIYMCSKLSTFSAIASLINDIPLMSFFSERESTLIRCGADVYLLGQI